MSKTESHGCIRLTNWDAVDLAAMVQKGMSVAFLEGGADAMASVSEQIPSSRSRSWEEQDEGLWAARVVS